MILVPIMKGWPGTLWVVLEIMHGPGGLWAVLQNVCSPGDNGSPGPSPGDCLDKNREENRKSPTDF